MYNGAKHGWYKLLNPDKFIQPIDEYMGSFRDGKVEYKSKLELNAIRYCDFNKQVVQFSVEPFGIKYTKPTDGKIHRYFIDLYIRLSSGDRLIVEVKSKSETSEPKIPLKKTKKTELNYHRALITYSINQAKWKAAREFAKENNMKFIILTEDHLH